MRSELRLALEFLAGLLIPLFILAPMGIDSSLGTCLCLICAGVSTFLIERGRTKKQAAAMDYLSYDKQTNTLTVKARKLENARVIKIKEMVDYNLNYHPSQMVYTGVTVGGVHTGGFHDAGNYYTMDGRSTKKYQLLYNGADVTSEDYCPIKVIKLDASLIEEAKKDTVVRQYLNADGTLTLSNNVESKNDELIGTSLNRKNVDLAMNLAKADYYNQQLSRDQCDAIKDWICSFSNDDM